MKFCNKCHKMKVKITNPNNLTRVCRCSMSDAMQLYSADALSRMRSEAQSVTNRTCRKNVNKIMMGVDARELVYE